MILTYAEAFSMILFILFSFADLRYRLVPAIELFFLGAAILSVPTSPIQVFLIIAAVAWGLLDRLPHWLPCLLLFSPPTWPVLIAGVGVRKALIGRADLLALGGIACIFPWYALILSLLGFELWRRWWNNRGIPGPIPAIPGLFLGLASFVVVRYVVTLM